MLPPEITLPLASAGGALVFSFIRPDRQSWVRSCGNMGCGTVISVFSAPAVCEWRGWDSIHQQHIAAFGIGLIGMVCCRAIVASVESDSAKVLMQLARRFIGVESERTPDEPRPKVDTPPPMLPPLPPMQRPRPDSDGLGAKGT